MDNGQPKTNLNWTNVGVGFSFIVVNALLSQILHLGVGASLLTAAVRCVIQLSIMALVLQSVFDASTPVAVAGISALLMVLGTFETVANKAKRRHQHMIPTIFIAMSCSSIPVSILGSRFGMGYEPFWQPAQFIPTLGMLCGNTISSMTVSITSVLKELEENREKIEMQLAFGASRFEAAKPLITDALRLALLPTINQMSVIGLISIPGMMTGAILGGASVEQAAKLQMVIMFMISSSAALSSMIATVLALNIVIDNEHRIRPDRIYSNKFIIWRAVDSAASAVYATGKHAVQKVFHRGDTSNGETRNSIAQPLLG
jgi:uncharacterized protein (TIGR00245 family)